jgi:hypothetical protein
MKKKVAKKIDVNNHKNYKVHFGTMDRIKSNSLYISISSWVQPKVESNVDYDKILRKINKKIKNTLFSNLDNKLFDNKLLIVDLDLRVSGIRFDKSVEDVHLDEIINKHITEVINEVLDKNEYFSFHKTKK